MTDENKYLFDINGYLVVDNVLTRDRCNNVIDAFYEALNTPNDQLPEDIRHRSKIEHEMSLSGLASIGPILLI